MREREDEAREREDEAREREDEAREREDEAREREDEAREKGSTNMVTQTYDFASLGSSEAVRKSS